MTEKDDPESAGSGGGPAPPARVLLVTGMSGAGKTSALKILEDLGWEVVDNLPLFLLNALLGGEAGDGGDQRKALAVGIDSRTRNFNADALVAEVGNLRERADLDLTMLFFDCDSDVLQNRFTATRRRHPMAGDRPVTDGIDLERGLMAALRDQSDQTIDTSAVSLPDLRQFIAANYMLADDPGLHISVTSFSYRRGLPREADLVFDVRFLQNPFYQPDLRPRTGQDAEVAAFIAEDPAWPEFRDALQNLLATLLPHYKREGKSYLTIAFGCTGGRHRSVFATETAARMLIGEGHRVTLRHRDVENTAD